MSGLGGVLILRVEVGCLIGRIITIVAGGCGDWCEKRRYRISRHNRHHLLVHERTWTGIPRVPRSRLCGSVEKKSLKSSRIT